MNSVSVLEPGLYTSIQDIGRFGYQKYGVIVSGAMDSYALRIANLLVGNKEEEAGIEMTLSGATLQFQKTDLIAITGGDFMPHIDEKPAPMWRPILISKGSVLQFKFAVKGCRAYIAFAGGIQVPKVMRSKSTYVRAGIGGLYGRILQRGDGFTSGNWSYIAEALAQKLASSSQRYSWSVNPYPLIRFHQNPSIRVLKGSEYDRFDEASKQAFFSAPYTITPQADRMGYRLTGPSLALAEKIELFSEAVTYGTVQVPTNGLPIILMADRQTTGGYPKIAQVITADLSTLAQLQPNTSVRFQKVDLEEAETIFLQNEHILQQIAIQIEIKASY
ncbi:MULTISPECIES: biotin-dependent carboxyltransferase family protein [Clostridia]|uniref:5-oxoprolinase subunit C family protein n=1 Tax=Clostridia TaxID=186801 RepID=UPI000EA2A284|nr:MULTISPECIES: biotin-dependent carboxyltransferase family protein [Clostridia]NBJ69643.1 biotin-dependent carboxyltransferase family protein [Roseburia sp. 1XD42-34]RKI78303.1 biotin-dependent carboxyltransferase family protein [Clostridium sp. 1xD42-85]